MTERGTRSMRRAAALTIWLLLVAMLSVAGEPPPAGWHKSGRNPDEYDVGVDMTTRHKGNASAFLKATADELHGYASLMQSAAVPTRFLGKRIRLSGYLKTENVETGWAGLWLRIDGSHEGEMLGFDNMQKRPLKGTTDWTPCSIVLDVPARATALSFGLILEGDGQVWMDDLRFEVVLAATTRVTGALPLTEVPRDGPQNLDFEK